MADKRFSIIQNNFNDRICYVCGRTNAHKHEIMFGSNRDLSIKYGLCVCLCQEHHTGSNGVHNNRELDLFFKALAQNKFEQKYPALNWLSIFRRNYK